MSDDASPKRTVQRRRRANVAGGREQTGCSHRVLASAGEEERLRELAAEQNVTVPRLLVESALAEGGETSTQRRAVIAELFAARRDLAGAANNVNQLARLGNTDGRLPVGTAAALQRLREVSDRVDAAIDGLAL